VNNTVQAWNTTGTACARKRACMSPPWLDVCAEEALLQWVQVSRRVAESSGCARDAEMVHLSAAQSDLGQPAPAA